MARLSPRIQQQKSLPSIGQRNKSLTFISFPAHKGLYKVGNVQKGISLCGQDWKDNILFHVGENDK